ncbi:MAG: ammonia-forming cytochrome c nitrite reductase subunit c552 [Candidatus Omnitrophota bacterium]
MMKKNLLMSIGALLGMWIAAVTSSWPIEVSKEYAGSEKCSVCHFKIYDKWKTTLHSGIYLPPVPENVISNFSGDVTLSDSGKGIPATIFTLDNNGGNGPFTVTVKGQKFTVDRVHGGKPIAENEDPNSPNTPGKAKYIGKQRYQTKIGNNYVILPLQWNPIPDLDGKSSGWVSYNLQDWVDQQGNVKPKPETKSEEQNCAGCHQTGVSVVFNDSAKLFEMAASEENIACEACHGPGADHAATADKMKIVNPNALIAWQQKTDVCGQCHSRIKSKEIIGGMTLSYAYANGRGFIPGDLLEDFANDAGGYWNGGLSKQHHQQHQDYVGHGEYMGSAHARAGMTCWSCHNPHGSDFEHDLVKSARDNGLCLQCHAGKFPDNAAIENHSKHAVSNTASPKCIDCHMSAAQKSAVDYDIHQHSFRVLTPAQTLAFVQPNACALCHRSYQGVTDTNIAKWDEESDKVINTWLSEQFLTMFGYTNINGWELY